MMAGLGLARLFAPAALSRVDIAVGLLAAAGAVTALMSAVERRLHPTDARPERED
jgi:hypothetical protein